MEGGEENHGKRAFEGGFLPPEKKQWKSPSQVQILESAYAVTPKPSAHMKEELARMTGLDYKQVQYWFGNRRFSDRHGPRQFKPKNDEDDKYIAFLSSSSSECSRDGGGHLDSQRHLLNPQPLSVVIPSDMQPSMSPAVAPRRIMQSWAHSSAIPEGQLTREFQYKVRQVERRLGHHLIAEGPILGVEFNPLPPGAFGACLELTPKNRTSYSFSGEAAGGLNNQPIKAAMFSLNSSATLAACSSHKSDYDPHKHAHGLLPFGVPKYQFLPTERSFPENSDNVTNVHLENVFANSMVLMTQSGSQSLSECASVPSSVTSQSMPTSASHHLYKGNDKQVPSTLVGKEATIDPFFLTPNVQYNIDLVTDKRSLAFCDKEIFDDSVASMTGKMLMSSVGSTCKEKSEHQYSLHISETFNYNGEINVADPGTFRSTSNHDIEMGTFGISRVASRVVNNKNLDQVMQNHCSKHNSKEFGDLKGYGYYVVRHRESSEGTCKSEMSYFSDIGGNERSIVAKWNAREKRAEYAVYNNDNSMSESNETDSTHSDGYSCKIAATNLADCVQSKLEIIDVNRDGSNQEINEKQI